MTSAIDIENHPAAAFGFYQEFAALAGDWRTFPRHYLLYASSGVFRLEVAQMQWLLPPQRAAWIAADVPIRVSIRARQNLARIANVPMIRTRSSQHVHTSRYADVYD